ncbi:MAG: 30S ribosomal protein S8 [Chloroflexi bacterium]|nr:30S ribosomal protein S8 [Chloroflexota bacterium]
MRAPATDPVADMLTRIRNAISVRRDTVSVPGSKLKLELAKLLQKEGFIAGVEQTDTKPQPMLKLHLRYYENRDPVITGLRRVSRPGLRVYVGRHEIPRLYGGLGVSFVSTSKGIMTGREAWKSGLGGELLFYVW